MEEIMKAFFYTMKVQLITQLTYRFDVLNHIIGNGILMYTMIILWKTAFNGLGEINGVNEQQMLTYSVISIILEISLRPFVAWVINQKINDGQLAYDFVKPVHPLKMLLAKNISVGISKVFLVGLPLFAIFSYFYYIPIPSSFRNFILFFVSCSLSFMILWILQAIIGMISFWMVELGSLVFVSENIIRLLSGAIIPIWFFPKWLRGIMNFLPFKYTYQIPLSIYIGKINSSEIFYGMILQLIWIAMLSLALKILWSNGEKKVVIQGG